MINKKILFVLIFLFSHLHCQAWQRQGMSYEPNMYQGGAQNWQMRQSKEGWLYIANNNGLLEFDGHTWTLYPMGDKIVRAINFVDDKIYAGGSNEFGYFKKDSKGLFVFNSLSAQLSEKWKGDVWDIYSIGNYIYILDDYHVYVYKEDKYQHTIESKYKIDCSVLINNNIYIGTPNGIFYLSLESNEFQNLRTDNNQLTNAKIVEIVPYKNKMVIVTARSGIYMLDGNRCTQIRSIADDFIDKNQLFCAGIQGELLALGSVQNGVFLLDFSKPQYHEILNQSNMLKNNTVLSCFFDKNKNLWLGLDSGISYINMDDLISPLFAKESPIGTGYCSYSYNNMLYLGTNQGLYQSNKKDTYSLVKDSEGQIISLFEYDNLLFCCGDNGIIVISTQGNYKIDISGAGAIQPIMHQDDKLIVVTYFGFKIIEKKNGKWQYSHSVNGFTGSCKGSIRGVDRNVYWQANSGDSFVNKIILDDKLENVRIERYSLGKSKVSFNSSISMIDANPVVCATDGLFRYDSATNMFIPYPELESLLDGKTNYQYLFVDKMKNIWFKTNGTLRFLPYSNSYFNKKIYHIGLESQMLNGEENITMVDSTTAIINSYKAFVMIRTDKVLNEYNPAQVHIRKIMTIKDNNVVSYGKTIEELELPYTLNSVNISWGAFNTDSHGEVLFSYRLVGLDNDWSIPSANNVKEYTNLSEGKYTFEVRTIVKGKVVEIRNSDKITFHILPPWYRSAWAYIVYAFLAITAFYIAYQMITRKQERIIKEKKKTIELQRLLLEEESRVKDQKIHELEKEKLTADLQYKTLEMTGYILNISRKNEMFDNIKKEAETTIRLIDNKESNNAVRKKISDLIININNNLKHDEDFDVFKSNFDILHKGFFKTLESKYPQLTKKDKVLCAYIKMNLVSKEIAPLLNISVRGVEINRYNLRKKMDLDRSVNLSEFIQNIIDEEDS